MFEGIGVVTVGVARTVIVFDAEQTTFFVVAESTELKLYVVVEEGLTRRVVPEPIEAPPHEA